MILLNTHNILFMKKYENYLKIIKYSHYLFLCIKAQNQDSVNPVSDFMFQFNSSLSHTKQVWLQVTT